MINNSLIFEARRLGDSGLWAFIVSVEAYINRSSYNQYHSYAGKLENSSGVKIEEDYYYTVHFAAFGKNQNRICVNINNE